jgi:hypothetical protein
MTRRSAAVTISTALVDGVDVDAVAAAVRGCAGVSALDGGPFGETVTYLPRRTVDGVVVGGGRMRVQIRSRWGVEAPVLAVLIATAVAPLTGLRPVDVVIADIDDPPSGPPAGQRVAAGHRGRAPAARPDLARPPV